MTADSYANTLRRLSEKLGQIHMMEAAEHELEWSSPH